MSNDTPEPSPAAPTPVLPVVTTGSGSPAPARRGGVWLGALALLLAVLTLMMAGLLWQKVDFTQKELARRTQVSETQS